MKPLLLLLLLISLSHFIHAQSAEPGISSSGSTSYSPTIDPSSSASPTYSISLCEQKLLLTMIFPPNGTSHTEVAISANFGAECGGYQCIFKDQTVDAEYLDSNNIVCEVPTLSLSSKGQIDVYIVRANTRITSNTIHFGYLGRFTPESRALISIFSVLLFLLCVVSVVLAASWFKRNERSLGASAMIINEETRLLAGSGQNSDFVFDTEGDQVRWDEIKWMTMIDKGSIGEIYKGTWRGTVVALKKIRSVLITDESMRELRKEVSIMRKLRHPNVLQFFGTSFNPDEHLFVIIMELMPKGSLYRMIHSVVSLSLDQIRSILIDTACGMDYLHNLNPPIIHRDLKSHNLLISDGNRIKVCDFGLSKIMVPASTTMTQSGTPAWAAPELLRGERYDTPVDIYSFGVVVWELFSRDIPFINSPTFQIMKMVGENGVRPPLDALWPEEFCQLMTSCWNNNPSARPTFNQIQEMLREI
eukprot:TRINITY_DN5410_c0_g1_i1.p1 TRINITY_DN5410_c0_g1~~TRINITY_DN5410_c0_g1_i1.p1  ORF type:complete len:474 (-),score=96.74 TRINITY_DN5410_c0_g1_i1:88-1509(-)